MKTICSVCCIFFCSILFGAAPWEVDTKTYDFLDAKIVAKHQERSYQCRDKGIDYLVDRCISKINFTNSTCIYCQSKSTDQDLENTLYRAGFQKKEGKGKITGHCFGTTINLAKQLLSQPNKMKNSCQEILYELTSRPDFMHASHVISTNQPSNYRAISPYRCDIPIELNPNAMKSFLHMLIGEMPEDYLFIHVSQADASKFDRVAIYQVLQKYSNKLLLVGYADKNNNLHCILAYTHPQKILFFDSLDGLFQFPDLETLSWGSGNALNGSKLRWIASFSL